MNPFPQRLRAVWQTLAAPEPDLTLASSRIRLVERDVGLPVKAAILLAVGWFLYFSLNIEGLANTSEVALEAVRALRQVFVVYALVNAFLALPIWAFRQMPLKAIQWIVFTTALLDTLFMAALTLVTDGFDSILFWVFPVLAVRNVLSMPVAPLQILLNFMVALAYVAAGVLDLYILKLDEQTEVMRATEPFLIRVFLLLLLGIIFGVLRMLWDRERLRLTEAAEFALRQEQMRTAGRLAAEIAHQIKNPLGIINTAAFSVQRSANGLLDPSASRQLQIIRDEVERSDRIITDLIGFAQLAEGKVERLEVIAEIEAALARVFPAGSGYQTRIVRDFTPPAPVLMLSKRCFAEILDNLLKNARDILGGAGTVRIAAHYGPEYTIEITIADDGPGIPAEYRDRIFDAYFSTKKGGTGLGLAIVKQNVEMFGGQVQVESEAGKGAAFHLVFPGRTTLHSRR
jgi:signal transduction histidine kinase